jgi:GGDEF domain-containing protein
LAERDPLTGLRNRRGFEAMLRAEQERCDGVLWRCAELLSRNCQSFDVTGRVVGDEFAALAVETELIGARALATRRGAIRRLPPG